MQSAVYLTTISAVSAYSPGELLGYGPSPVNHSIWPPEEDNIELYNVGLGNFRWNLVDSTHTGVQEYCNQGWNYVAAFDFRRAILSFRSAANLDKNCHMCRWAEAFALGPNLNTMDTPLLLQSVPLGFQIAKEVHNTLVALDTPEDEREAIVHAKRVKLAQALALRYKPTVHEFVRKEQECRNGFAEIVEKLAIQPDAGVFEKLLAINGLMNTHPWDYWLDAVSNSPRPETARALALFEQVLPTEHADNTGQATPIHSEHDSSTTPERGGSEYWDGFACHLYIHLTEANKFTAPWAKYCARKLATYVTASPHLWHMGFHTIMHIGPDYSQAIRDNIVACDMTTQVYPMHNLESLAWLCRASLHEDCAMDASMRLSNIAREGYAAHGDFYELPFPNSRSVLQEPFTLLAFEQYDKLLNWTAATALPGADDDLILRSMEAFLHGMVYAKRPHLQSELLGDIAKAKGFLSTVLNVRIQAMNIKSSKERNLDPFYNFDGSPELGVQPLADMLKVAEFELKSYIAYAEKDTTTAIQHLSKAWELQKELPYDEPPFWYIPLGEKLAGLLLEQKFYDQSKDIYTETISMYPGNIASMKGLLAICRIEEYAAYNCETARKRVDVAIANVDEAVNSSSGFLQSLVMIPVVNFAIIMALVVACWVYNYYFRKSKKRGGKEKKKRKVKKNDYASISDTSSPPPSGEARSEPDRSDSLGSLGETSGIDTQTEGLDSEVEVKDEPPEMALREVASKLRSDFRRINSDHISSDTVHYVVVPKSHETSRQATKETTRQSSGARQRRSPAGAVAKRAAAKSRPAASAASSSAKGGASSKASKKTSKESSPEPSVSDSEQGRRAAALDQARVVGRQVHHKYADYDDSDSVRS